MIDSGLIELVLWAPFALIVLIAGIVFCINGYRKGLWRALLSMGATLVSALICVFLTPLIAKISSKSFGPMIEEMDLLGSVDVDPALVEMVNELVCGLMQSIVSLVLFGVMFFMFTNILKIVSAKVKKEALITEQKGLKFAGLGVRLLDTVLYALIILMPLYGTVSAYVPAVTEVLNSSFVEDDDAKVLADTLAPVNGHFLVKAEGIVPLSTAYNHLSAFNYGDKGATVCLPKLADTVEIVLKHYNLADGSLNSLLESDLDAEIGSLLNDQDLMVMLKEYLLGTGMDTLIAGLGDAELGAKIKDTLLGGFSYEPIKDKGQQAREGRAILLIAFSADSKTAVLGNVLEGLGTHPMIGAERVGTFIKESGLIPDIDESIVDKLVDKLEECTAQGYDGPRFAEYYSAIEGLLTMISTQDITELIKNGEANLYFLEVDPAALSFASELFKEYIGGMADDMGPSIPVIGDVLAALPEKIQQAAQNENFDVEKEYESIATMLEIAEIATGGEEELEELINSYSSENRIEVNGEVIEDPLAWYAESDLVPSLLETLVEEKGSDPMGIGESLTTEQKEIFAGHLDDYLKEVYPEGNEDLEKDLEILKNFLGMNE